MDVRSVSKRECLWGKIRKPILETHVAWPLKKGGSLSHFCKKTMQKGGKSCISPTAKKLFGRTVAPEKLFSNGSVTGATPSFGTNRRKRDAKPVVVKH